jgi:hypothetical protein
VLWHCAQLVLLDGALAWIAAIAGITAKLVLVWHAVQVADAEVGIWLSGFETARKSTKLAWQLEQSSPTGCAASATLNWPASACGRV